MCNVMFSWFESDVFRVHLNKIRLSRLRPFDSSVAVSRRDEIRSDTLPGVLPKSNYISLHAYIADKKNINKTKSKLQVG